MTPSVSSLPPELLWNIVEKLSVKDMREFLASSSKIYNDSRPAFSRRCFRIIPLALEHESILQAEDLSDNESFCFVQEIIIWVDRKCDPHPEKIHLRDRLLSIFTIAGIVSTKFDTITIQYDPEDFNLDVGRYRAHTKAIGRAMKTFLDGHNSTDFKIDIQNIRLHDCANLFALGKSFIKNVHSIGLRLEPYDTIERSVQKLLPLATNLMNISLKNDTGETLTSHPIQQVMKAVGSESLESVSFSGFTTTNDKLEEILHPLKRSLKSIKLQQMVFRNGSFKSFVRNVFRNYSLEDFNLEDIWEVYGGKEHEVIDPMWYWNKLHHLRSTFIIKTTSKRSEKSGEPN